MKKKLKIDSAEFAALKEISKNFEVAIDFILNHNLEALPLGSGNELDGRNVFYNVVDSNLKSQDAARYEVHNVYYDLQIPLSKPEGFGIKPRKDCTQPDGEFNTEKDILFYSDPVEEVTMVSPGEAIVLAPEDAHAPLIGEGTIRKIIFKIKA